MAHWLGSRRTWSCILDWRICTAMRSSAKGWLPSATCLSGCLPRVLAGSSVKRQWPVALREQWTYPPLGPAWLIVHYDAHKC
ncbi:uncharacterized protein B0I36DRAFT_318626 [Microdochium trichocladiopsis]|uniref:Uncharacterized protein n=1 Tax=Microdochium trichocladiopsis TaxID=1682393 RepID=A0A9P8YCT1_9PEZI|nr:uncharacterized protein B0I36DRAFT_318626 [Microdochium trichocladiopsis]KAH7035575.1 hypothetical protein B0I36DRAFT_318626 [Microdochium trichocladiopsis]